MVHVLPDEMQQMLTKLLNIYMKPEIIRGKSGKELPFIECDEAKKADVRY